LAHVASSHAHPCRTIGASRQGFGREDYDRWANDGIREVLAAWVLAAVALSMLGFQEGGAQVRRGGRRRRALCAIGSA
jgi:hypothetical protein